jgi:hypothetical protein
MGINRLTLTMVSTKEMGVVMVGVPVMSDREEEEEDVLVAAAFFSK